MKTLFKAFVCLLVLSLPLPALAGTVKEYTADMVNVKTGKAEQRLAVMPDMIYSEVLNAQGQKESFSILRLDHKKIYVFLENNKSYMELPFNKDQFNYMDFNFGAAQVKGEKVGTETINSYKADKIRTTINVMGLNESVFYQWVAPEFEPMPVRTEDVNGNVMEMRNIKPNRPDSALFEIPAGYTRNEQMEQLTKTFMLSMGQGSEANGQPSRADMQKAMQDVVMKVQELQDPKMQEMLKSLGQ